MKQYQFQYREPEQFRAQLIDLRRQWAHHSFYKTLFHIFADYKDDHAIHDVRDTIREIFPDAMVAGSATYGTICEGKIRVDQLLVMVTVMEKRTSEMEVLYYPLQSGQATEVAWQLVEEVNHRQWVKAVECLIMFNGESLQGFCEALSALREDIEVVGGEAHFAHAEDAARYVINNDGVCSHKGVVFVLYGGPEFHIKTDLIRGWKPLGRAMQANRYYDNVLCELDGEGAHSRYYRYLKIKDDEHYFFNVLEFPLLFQLKNGSSVIRMPVTHLEDGSMTLAAVVPESESVRITYGDPSEILQSVQEGGALLQAFRPEGLFLFSCGSRRVFWGDSCDKETAPLETLAPTYGYYTAGELLRTNGTVCEHNCTLVIAAMREGALEEAPEKQFQMKQDTMSHERSLIMRFANFIGAATDELEEANRQLIRLSTTDGLTGLLNRREMERRIQNVILKNLSSDESHYYELLLMDLDNFKRINDEFGHQEGDLVLQEFSRLLQDCAAQLGTDISIGRWGGEEFIMLCETQNAGQAMYLAEQIRTQFSNYEFTLSGRHTVSIGMTHMRAGEDLDVAVDRADKAMYEAKSKGKNRVIER